MKVKTYLMVTAIALLISPYAFAEEQDHHGHKGSMAEHVESATAAAVEVGNKICPVSGQKVGEMGPAVKVEHNGKIYNLCCPGCVEMFKADPDKYIKKVEGEMGEENGHEGHHHMMGEKDGHMMVGMDKDMPMMKHHEESSMTDEAQVKEINLEAYQFRFSPETITVNKGDIVKIHATSRDVPHGVFIKEYGINEKVEKGKITDIEFTADKSGEFDIICSVYCGQGHQNMKAKLVVKE